MEEDEKVWQGLLNDQLESVCPSLPMHSEIMRKAAENEILDAVLSRDPEVLTPAERQQLTVNLFYRLPRYRVEVWDLNGAQMEECRQKKQHLMEEILRLECDTMPEKEELWALYEVCRTLALHYLGTNDLEKLEPVMRTWQALLDENPGRDEYPADPEEMAQTVEVCCSHMDFHWMDGALYLLHEMPDRAVSAYSVSLDPAFIVIRAAASLLQTMDGRMHQDFYLYRIRRGLFCLGQIAGAKEHAGESIPQAQTEELIRVIKENQKELLTDALTGNAACSCLEDTAASLAALKDPVTAGVLLEQSRSMHLLMYTQSKETSQKLYALGDGIHRQEFLAEEGSPKETENLWAELEQICGDSRCAQDMQENKVLFMYAEARRAELLRLRGMAAERGQESREAKHLYTAALQSARAAGEFFTAFAAKNGADSFANQQIQKMKEIEQYCLDRVNTRKSGLFGLFRQDKR